MLAGLREALFQRGDGFLEARFGLLRLLGGGVAEGFFDGDSGLAEFGDDVGGEVVDGLDKLVGGGAWGNAQSSAGGSYAEQTLSGLSTAAAAVPEGIRVQIMLPEGGAITGTITQDWVNPVLGGNKT